MQSYVPSRGRLGNGEYGHVTRGVLLSKSGNVMLDPGMQRPVRLLARHGTPFARWSSSSSIEKKAETVDTSLLLLQRPLGVKDRPVAHNKTWDDTKKELMDQETRLQQRQHL